jgi:hypothetical protein
MSRRPGEWRLSNLPVPTEQKDFRLPPNVVVPSGCQAAECDERVSRQCSGRQPVFAARQKSLAPIHQAAARDSASTRDHGHRKLPLRCWSAPHGWSAFSWTRWRAGR